MDDVRYNLSSGCGLWVHSFSLEVSSSYLRFKILHLQYVTIRNCYTNRLIYASGVRRISIGLPTGAGGMRHHQRCHQRSKQDL